MVGVEPGSPRPRRRDLPSGDLDESRRAARAWAHGIGRTHAPRGAGYSVPVHLGAAHGPPVSPTPQKWRAGTVQDRSLSVQILTRPVRHGSAITAAHLVSFQVLNFSLCHIKKNFNI